MAKALVILVLLWSLLPTVLSAAAEPRICFEALEHYRSPSGRQMVWKNTESLSKKKKGHART